MNAKVNDMISGRIILVKVIVQGKADKSHRPEFGAFEACCQDFFEGKMGQANMGVFTNSLQIVKHKGRFQSAAVDCEHNNCKEQQDGSSGDDALLFTQNAK